MATVVETDYGPIDIETREATSSMSDGVAIFNPAIKATHITSGHPVIVLAVEGASVLTVDVDGKLHWIVTDKVQLDWRYDFKKEKWIDGAGVALEDEPG